MVMSSQRWTRSAGICLAMALAATPAAADVSLPKIFTSNMVLQRNIKIPIWGVGLRSVEPPGSPGSRRPRNPLTGQHRPANLYTGVLQPIIGYGIRGTIWYQGERNSGRLGQAPKSCQSCRSPVAWC